MVKRSREVKSEVQPRAALFGVDDHSGGTSPFLDLYNIN